MRHEVYNYSTEQTKTELDTLVGRICELEVAAASCRGELGVVARSMQSMEGRVAAGEDEMSTAGALARETLEKMSQFRILVEG